MDYKYLLSDIGGTYARFALGDGQRLHAVRVYPVTIVKDATMAIEHYLKSVAQPCPRYACMAIAAPVDDHYHCLIEHRAWHFDHATLQQHFQFQELLFINDCAALALALPQLQGVQIQSLGKIVTTVDNPCAVCTLGTGLGVAGLLREGTGKWRTLFSEGGQINFAAETELEHEIAAHWQRPLNAPLNYENLLCGQGIVDIYRTLCILQQTPYDHLDAAAIQSRARMNLRYPIASRTMQVYYAVLAGFAANMTLMLGARGGVYIGGGIAAKIASQIDADAFRLRFENRGRFAGYLRCIATHVVSDPFSALNGAQVLLHQQLSRDSDPVYHL